MKFIECVLKKAESPIRNGCAITTNGGTETLEQALGVFGVGEKVVILRAEDFKQLQRSHDQHYEGREDLKP